MLTLVLSVCSNKGISDPPLRALAPSLQQRCIEEVTVNIGRAKKQWKMVAISNEMKSHSQFMVLLKDT